MKPSPRDSSLAISVFNLATHETKLSKAALSAIIEYELIPMLGEYWFDDQEKVRLWSEALRRSIQ